MIATQGTTRKLRVSRMAETLIGSEIIRLAAEVNEKIRQGEKIYNFTIGDFDSKIFPIPIGLETAIRDAYLEKTTNYPPANGVLELRKEVSRYISEKLNLDYSTDEIVITSGARPCIHAIYTTVLDPGDKVIYPVPSWNNNHYCHLSSAVGIPVETKAENNFMPTAEDIAPHIAEASLISLCSPLNPTGTTFSANELGAICDLVLKENNRRGPDKKPLYVLYDQIYWVLTFGETKHVNPVSLRPEMRNYTIFVDGISKALAATGVRVGWTFGPQRVIEKMRSIISHVGAWAPKPEQIATARFLKDMDIVDAHLNEFRHEIETRLVNIYRGFQELKKEGHDVDAIAPQAAIYLTVRFNLKGKKMQDGSIIQSTSDMTSYILNEAKMALVPFYAFGASNESNWYRLSVGTCKIEDTKFCIDNLRSALEKLK
jgi:aspartate aminotransferase